MKTINLARLLKVIKANNKISNHLWYINTFLNCKMIVFF